MNDMPYKMVQGYVVATDLDPDKDVVTLRDNKIYFNPDAAVKARGNSSSQIVRVTVPVPIVGKSKEQGVS